MSDIFRERADSRVMILINLPEQSTLAFFFGMLTSFLWEISLSGLPDF